MHLNNKKMVSLNADHRQTNRRYVPVALRPGAKALRITCPLRGDVISSRINRLYSPQWKRWLRKRSGSSVKAADDKKANQRVFDQLQAALLRSNSVADSL